jgi:hypothetical protein
MDEQVTTEKTRRSPMRTEVLMAVVVVVTLLAIWLVPGEKQPTPPSLPELPGTPAGTGTDLGLPSPEDTGAATVAEGDRAREFIASLRTEGDEPDPAVVFDEAQRFRDQGHGEDAYLLYRYAARHGQAQAALILGTQADPALFSEQTSPLSQPAPEQALKWYRIAMAAGSKEAEIRLQDLRKRLEQAAADGDENAQRLMLQWR